MTTVLGRRCWSRIVVAGLALIIAGSASSALRPGTDLVTAKAHTEVVVGSSLPDLAIESARVRLSKQCGPATPLLFITARITNHGKGPVFSDDWSGLVYAMERHTKGWGNGLKLPALAQGASKSVTFPVYYLTSAPREMTGTHHFLLAVAIDSVEESDYTNNRFGPISVTVPRQFCAN